MKKVRKATHHEVRTITCLRKRLSNEIPYKLDDNGLLIANSLIQDKSLIFQLKGDILAEN